MVVGKSVIDGDVLEEPFDVLVKKSLDFAVVELRVNEEGADVGLHNIRESLNSTSASTQYLRIQFEIPLELSLSNSSSLGLHWRPFPPLRDLARIHDSGSR